MKCQILALSLGFILASQATEYDVGTPEFRPRFSGAEPGIWTLDHEAAISQAKAEGRHTILLFTGSWWCPYCHTLDKRVLRNDQWLAYVEENGFYLAEVDFPYRGIVPEDQVWKSSRPDLGEGWGFKCWYMNPDYLRENGLSEEDGLRLIAEEYEYQNQMSTPQAAQKTIRNWDGLSEITYGRVGYPTMIVIGPAGNELGRFSFPWNDPLLVTDSEAQEHVIQSVERLIQGDPILTKTGGNPDLEKAYSYLGWVSSATDGIVGQVTVTTGKLTRKNEVKIGGNVVIRGRRYALTRLTVPNANADNAMSNLVLNVGRVGHLSLSITGVGLTGTLELNGESESLLVSGARDANKAHDVMRTARFPEGLWTVVLEPQDEEPQSPFARGFGGLSVQIRLRGRALISGVLADGTRVKANAQMLAGDDGVSALPVRIELDGKRGGFGFVMFFKDGRFLRFMNVAPWICGNRAHEFISHLQPRATIGCSTCEILEDELDLQISGLVPGTKIKELELAEDVSTDFVLVRGRKWTGFMTSFTAALNSKTGLCSGGMKLPVLKNGRSRSVAAQFRGTIMGGAVYGTLIVSGAGSWPVRIAACGSCDL